MNFLFYTAIIIAALICKTSAETISKQNSGLRASIEDKITLDPATKQETMQKPSGCLAQIRQQMTQQPCSQFLTEVQKDIYAQQNQAIIKGGARCCDGLLFLARNIYTKVLDSFLLKVT